MGELVATGSKYSDETRLQAVTSYAVHGVASIVSRELNIPESTLCQWRQEDWWVEKLEEVRSLRQDEHITRYHAITEAALSKAQDSIESLSGELTASDIKSLVVTGATATDKARLLMNQPTSIRAEGETMQGLLEQFKKLAQDHRNIQDSVVSVQEQGEETA